MAAKPLEQFFNTLLGGKRKTSASPTETLGSPGTAIFGGFVVENEKDGALSDRERYRAFSEALANTAIVGAGVRYFLNLAAKASWTFEPADHPEGERLAELAETIIMEDPATSWARIVRRAAMYRFYGFSIQEWTARRREDGVITFLDIAPRAQITIERWDANTDGSLNGMVQRNPQNQEEIYLPRSKVLYLVDDALNDSPQGLGLFRHIAEPVKRLNRYEQLEGFGFEMDLRGVPIGKAPYSELRRRVDAGEITAAEAQAAVAPVEKFIQKHIRKPDLGLLLDSVVYQSTDDAQRPSNQAQFDVTLLDGNPAGLVDVAKAIERINREIARLLGVESIILGDGDAGSNALSKDKTNQFSLTVDSTLDELGEGFEDDLLTPIWQLNGWPEEAKPKMRAEAVQYRDVEQITMAIKDLAQSGAPLDPEDPSIDEVRALLGLSPHVVFRDLNDEALTGSDAEEEGSVEDPEEDMPEKPADREE